MEIMNNKERVDVYWNINKKCFSVKSCKTGKVILHTDKISLEDAKFVVREGGRQRVLREKQKNVHAFVRGYVTSKTSAHKVQEATYNPYKYDSFVVTDTEEPVDSASLVELFTNEKIKGSINFQI
jgi:hypothetical protein